MLTVYAAGTISNDPESLSWRERAADLLDFDDVCFLSPTRGPDHGNLLDNGLDIVDPLLGGGNFVGRDLSDLRRADIVLFYWPGCPGRQSIGSFFELGIAYATGKTIVVVDSSDDRLVSRHPFIARLASAVFNTLDDGCDYISLFRS